MKGTASKCSYYKSNLRFHFSIFSHKEWDFFSVPLISKCQQLNLIACIKIAGSLSISIFQCNWILSLSCKCKNLFTLYNGIQPYIHVLSISNFPNKYLPALKWRDLTLQREKEERSQFCIVKVNEKFEFDVKTGLNTGFQGNHKHSDHMDRQEMNCRQIKMEFKSMRNYDKGA